MKRRIACVALPQIHLEIARERMEGGPFAIVVSRKGSAVKTERDVLGNTRLDVVSEEARALGIRAGQTTAAARAKSAELRVRVVSQDAVRVALVRVAESALAFGPVVAFDVAQDVVWVDVGGSAHLHGGERELAQALAARVRELGHACEVALADGPRIAAAVARFLPKRRNHPKGPWVVPEGKGRSAVRILPIAALGLDDAENRWLKDLGLHTCGDLQKVSRSALGVRLGARAHDVMQLLDGEDPSPLVAFHPMEILEERFEFEWGVHATQALLFVMKALCTRLSSRLMGRHMGAIRLEIVLGLDRALCKEGEPATSVIDVVLPAPIARAADLLAVVNVRLESVSLPAPVLAVTLRVPDLAGTQAGTLDLLTPEPKAHRVLPRLVAELSADFGAENVGTLIVTDTWVPEDRTRIVPFGAARLSARHPLVTSALEPSRLVPSRPLTEPLGETDAVLSARVEAFEWWRRGIERRDSFSVFLPVDERGDAKNLAWVEQGKSGQALLCGWVD